MSVTAPAGFRAAGVTAGLKASGRPDVALVVNDGPTDTLAAVFTSNRCRAAPVLWSEVVARGARGRAVVLNSGGANCYTGPEGFATTHASAERVAGLLGCGAGEVLVCSTGLIGEQLDRPRLLAGIDAAADVLDAGAGHDAALAIMTTDTRPKEAVVAREGWSTGGMAKGAAMLAPALATMLVVLTTDAVVDPADADEALRAATAATFDRLDSDGCQSTNDTVALLASGASGVSVGAAELAEALTPLCADLAAQLLGDAEGSEHDVAITVRGAATEDDALLVGRAVARSGLLKTAIFGRDPNWGRVLAAVGTTSAAFDPAVLDVAFNGVQLCRDGGIGEPRDLVDLSARAVTIEVDLKEGAEEATVWTNDLTHAYVHENSAYST
ncbi:bifunctional glutamate N-acetyltransferase/amino-acid acetyltransferase ArgJ [Pseudokineococcus sp. 1T1Z-3]|uniref:bifunctional glutamate N-acetyltransferase/amino-acid acetyltransferase ArgJ n=1 Tax=Pseudokineococcus sp. 1T1Z-3 TaxID=3132745 RepID=UPI0030ADDA83